jgi:hypothetical protein
MPKTMAKVLGLALAGASMYGLWSLASCGDEDEEVASTQHVVNQVWIERAPEGPRDMIGHLVLLDMPEGRIGVTGRSSQWRHLIELFQWGLEGHRLSTFFPQDRVKAQVRVRSWRCEGEAPEPFELCLEVSTRSRSATFYSLEEWKIDPKRVDESLAELEQQHPALADVMSEVSIPVALSPEQLEDYTEVDTLGVLGDEH